MSVSHMLQAAPQDGVPTLSRPGPPSLAPLIAQACKESGFPQRLDGRNAGTAAFTVSTLCLWWKSRHITLLKVTRSNKCATLEADGLELKFDEESSLLLAKSVVQNADATARKLPASLQLERLCVFLTKNIKEPLVFFFGTEWIPEPLAEVRSPRVTITMMGREPNPLFRDLIIRRRNTLLHSKVPT